MEILICTRFFENENKFNEFLSAEEKNTINLNKDIEERNFLIETQKVKFKLNFFKMENLVHSLNQLRIK